MEALDNPSYFSVPGVPTPCRRPFSLLRRRNMGAGHSSSSSSALLPPGTSLSAPSTPTSSETGGGGHTPPPPFPLAPANTPQHRRSFRSLLRSISASGGAGLSPDNRLQQQLLLLGEPRPSDVAPATPVLTHPAKGDHPHRHRRNLSVKTTPDVKSSLSSDMVYIPVTDAPRQEPLDPSPAVFLGRGGDARYYNITAAMTIPSPGSSANGRRRHSIGTFLNKDRSGTLTKTGRLGNADAEECAGKMGSTGLDAQTKGDAGLEVPGSSPGSVTGSSPDWRGTNTGLTDHVRSTHSRRRCGRCCANKGGRAADMEDILIVSSRDSQAAALWVNYLTTCFNQISKQRNRPPFKVLTVSLEDVVGPGSIPASLEEKMVRVKLQIVIVCPQFLEQVYQHPAPALGKLLQPDRVLAMLLGVEEDSVTEQHRAALITYQQWCRLAVKDQDASFVGDFLEVAMGILAKVLRQNTAHTEKAMFSLLPKKVKEGQNKVIVLLNDPISKEDKIKVSVDKNGERIDVTNVKRRNPFTLHFQMPAFCLEVSMLVNVYVEKNGEPLGCRQVKCESRMRELDQMLRSWDNPLEFMCQTLGFSPGNKEHLDNFLVSALQRNLPPHFNLLHTPTGHPHRAHASPEEYPTLLHFAARFGLEKLSWQLLECPGGEQACEIRNVCELTPAEMAEGAGHTKLANALRGYMQMTELTSMYSYLKIMSEGNNKVTGFPGVEYHHPRPLSETYMIPPSIPRPVMDNYQVPPAARPFNPLSSSPQDTELEGYMEMRPPGPKTRPALDQPLRPSLDFLTTVALPASDTSSDPRSPSPVLTTHSTRSTSRQHLDQISLNSSRSDDEKPSGGSVKKSREQLSQGAQDQLLEIINDFKNNVFTISEVEKLVDSWKNRNDVQQSFKDKQEQLSQMRQEYERLQAQMKEQMKRPTPFDRIRGFFKGKPKDMKETASDSSSGSPADGSKVAAVADNVPLCMRPVSSLSLHSTCSSSSSGRMSTVSGCSGISLGDSGTHSDPEDRKQMITLPYDGARLGKGIANYEIPPAPRPIITQQGRRFSPPRYTPAPVKLTAATVPCTCIEERPPQPMPRPDVPETEFDDGNCYISVGGICGPSQEELTAHLLTNTQDGISETNPTNTEYLSLELETGTGVKTPCGSHKCSALRDYMNVNKRDQGTDGGRSTGLEGSKTGVDDVTPASPCPSDASDLPDYINVTIPAVTSAPPIPVRQPYHTKI